MGEKTYRFCNLRKWKDFNNKQLTLHKMCVVGLSCVVNGPIYGHFMGCTVNGFLSLSMYKVCIERENLAQFPIRGLQSIRILLFGRLLEIIFYFLG